MRFECKHVWRELSNYLDGEIPLDVRREVDAHVAQCRYCAALLDSTHNVIVLIADERRLEVPLGFSVRLREKLQRELSTARPE